MGGRVLIVILLLIISFPGEAQDGNTSASLNGYVSNLQTAIFEDLDGEWTNDNLIHNRLNFRLHAGSSFTVGLEMRNRFFTGDMVRLDSDYSERIGNDPGWIDMAWNVFDENSFLLNTAIDRFWMDYSSGIIQLRIGRQRINWGQTFVWNPNDIFNAYSYFDFDYAERPGSDAIRLQIYPSFSSTIELAVKVDYNDDITAAGLYRFNLWAYDFQFLAGYVNSEDIVFGTGWSGAIGSTSFRGEISWFQPYENFSDTTGTGLFTIGLDRSFKNNGMIQFQLMYCNKPLDFSDFGSFYTGNLSAKDLAFSEVSVFANVMTPITPLFNLSMSAIWYPGLDGFFAGPSAEFSLAENLDFSFLWQYFNAKLEEERTRMNIGFLRVKYSF